MLTWYACGTVENVHKFPLSLFRLGFKMYKFRWHFDSLVAVIMKSVYFILFNDICYQTTGYFFCWHRRIIAENVNKHVIPSQTHVPQPIWINNMKMLQCA